MDIHHRISRVMNKFIILAAVAIALAPLSVLLSQEGLFTNIYENREEFVHMDRMSNGNILVSGKSHALGNKSDLVLLLGPGGQELKRKVLCPSCAADLVYYSRETLVGDIIHVRANGDVLASDLDLENTELLYNIAEDRFESIQTYQVLEHQNFIIVVSYAVENSVRGLLHTVIDTRQKVIWSQKFNVEFPDIAGSIGIDLFDDGGVVDGFNSFEDGISTAHLIRLGNDRSEQVWEVILADEDIILEDVMVTHSDDVYAVGTVLDPNDANHRQGILVGFDGEGNQLVKATFDSELKDDSNYTNVTKTLLEVTEKPDGNLLISGYVGGRLEGENVSRAIFVEVTREGKFVNGFSESVITNNNLGISFLAEKNGGYLLLGNAFNNNSNSGAFITFTNFTSDVDEVIAGPTFLMSFPNPIEDKLVISIPVDAKLESNVDIYNLVGNRVVSTPLTEIETGHLVQGTYLVTAVINGVRVTQKMTKL